MNRMGKFFVWVMLVVAALPFVVLVMFKPTAHSVFAALIVVGVGAIVAMFLRGSVVARSRKPPEH